MNVKELAAGVREWGRYLGAYDESGLCRKAADLIEAQARLIAAMRNKLIGIADLTDEPATQRAIQTVLARTIDNLPEEG